MDSWAGNSREPGWTVMQETTGSQCGQLGLEQRGVGVDSWTVGIVGNQGGQLGREQRGVRVVCWTGNYEKPVWTVGPTTAGIQGRQLDCRNSRESGWTIWAGNSGESGWSVGLGTTRPVWTVRPTTAGIQGRQLDCRNSGESGWTVGPGTAWSQGGQLGRE